MTLEFDKDGKIILPKIISEEKEQEKKSIILEKVQVNENNPAIAQLRVKIGENLNVDRNSLINEIKILCENYIKERFPSVESSINLNENTLIVETRKSKMMYSLLGTLIKRIRWRYKDYKITEKGSFGGKADMVSDSWSKK